MTSASTDALHPARDSVPLQPLPTEIVAERPAGTYVENLAPAADSSDWLVTVPSHNRIDRVSPDGRWDTVARLPHPPTGIATRDGQTLVISGPLGSPGWRLARLGPDGIEPACDLPDLLHGNGMTGPAITCWSSSRCEARCSPSTPQAKRRIDGDHSLRIVIRRLMVETLMRPVLIEVANELIQDHAGVNLVSQSRTWNRKLVTRSPRSMMRLRAACR
jgi:hypothetical protein